MSLLIPWLIVLTGMLVLALYVVVMALRSISQIAKRVSETNKQLLVLVAHQVGGDNAARALVASAKPPQRELPGISQQKKEKKKPKEETKGPDLDYKISVGVN